tara:strand:+ start:147 stop:728 length:582 start_codon:yes stop_codon:yes gene_type:complete
MLRKYIRLILEDQRADKLRVFDFDDTLAVSDSMVVVIHKNGASEELTPAEFNVYRAGKDDTFDFSQFENVINPRAVIEVTQILAKILAAESRGSGKRKIAVLTSRGPKAKQQIKSFVAETMSSNADIEIVTLASSDPNDKKDWIDRQIQTFGFTDVRFFDDSSDNVAAVLELREKYPDIIIRAQNVAYADSYS